MAWPVVFVANWLAACIFFILLHVNVITSDCQMPVNEQINGKKLMKKKKIITTKTK